MLTPDQLRAARHRASGAPLDKDQTATRIGAALYQSDIDAVKRIQAMYGLDSFSQALRRAIKIAVAHLDDEVA